jgi:hypothetical protein
VAFFLEIVKELGGQMTEDVRDCTVLVADQIKRTAKVSGTNIKARLFKFKYFAATPAPEYRLISF